MSDRSSQHVDEGEHEKARERPHQDVAHVTLGINDAPPESKTVPAGETLVSTLKTHFGIDLALVLYLVHGKQRRVLDNSETVKVESGMHFEAIGGGGVS